MLKADSDRVHRTLACSIHVVARIIGPEFTAADLTPAFAAFLSDPSEEVEQCAMDHFADYTLSTARDDGRSLLQRLRAVLEDVNSRFALRWRLRETAARALAPLADVFALDATVEAQDGYWTSYEKLLIRCLGDEAAAVRETAAYAVRFLLLLLSSRRMVQPCWRRTGRDGFQEGHGDG